MPGKETKGSHGSMAVNGLGLELPWRLSGGQLMEDNSPSCNDRGVEVGVGSGRHTN